MTTFCLSNEKDVDFLKEAFNILSEPNRIKILCILGKNESFSVGEIIEKLGLKQNLVSHHLSMLKRAGLVESQRKGTSILYKIHSGNYERLKGLVGHIFNF